MKRGSERTIPGGDAGASTGLTCRSAARIWPHMAASRLAGTIFKEGEDEEDGLNDHPDVSFS